MTLKWSILWIIFITIVFEHIEDCASGCGCGKKKVTNPSEPKPEITSRTIPDEQVPKHPPSVEPKKARTVVAPVCRAEESFWRAIGLLRFYQRRVMKEAQKSNQPKYKHFEKVEKQKTSKSSDDREKSKLEKQIPKPRAIDMENLDLYRSIGDFGMNADPKLKTILPPKYPSYSPKYRGRKKILN